MNLKSLPLQERPRERLARLGSDALSTIELIAILLGSGTKNRSVLQLASDLVVQFGSLGVLCDASVQELSVLKGIGQAKAVQLKAAFSMCARMDRSEVDRPLVDRSRKIYDLIGSEMRREKVEVLMVLMRDARKRLIQKEIVGRGILNEILVHPREIFHAAIRHRSHSIVIAHNHPSGDPAPSRRDLEMTQLLVNASRIVGIELADHLIIGRESYTSLADQGLM